MVEKDKECQDGGSCDCELSVFMKDHIEKVTFEPGFEGGREGAWWESIARTVWGEITAGAKAWRWEGPSTV